MCVRACVCVFVFCLFVYLCVYVRVHACTCILANFWKVEVGTLEMLCDLRLVYNIRKRCVWSRATSRKLRANWSEEGSTRHTGVFIKFSSLCDFATRRADHQVKSDHLFTVEFTAQKCTCTEENKPALACKMEGYRGFVLRPFRFVYMSVHECRCAHARARVCVCVCVCVCVRARTRTMNAYACAFTGRTTESHC